MVPTFYRYSWGWDIRWLGWYLCATTKPYTHIYLSPDATPNHEHAHTLYAYYPHGDW